MTAHMFDLIKSLHPERARRHRGSMNLNTSAAFVRSFKIKYGSTGEVRIAARTPSRPSGQSEAANDCDLGAAALGEDGRKSRV